MCGGLEQPKSDIHFFTIAKTIANLKVHQQEKKFMNHRYCCSGFTIPAFQTTKIFLSQDLASQFFTLMSNHFANPY